MKTKDIKDYVLFGRRLNFLRLIQEGWLYHGDKGVEGSIKRFCNDIESLNLRVTANTAYYNNLIGLKKRLDETREEYSIESQDRRDLKRIMDRLKNVSDAELKDKKVFIITEKRMNVEKLLENIGDLFAPETYKEIPDLSRYDFSEGAMCIAFERPTAAGFHILRGMEGILRWFFDILNSSSGCMANWGPLIGNLRNLPNPPPNEILDQSDAIRVNYRNPTAHPEMRYDIENVQDLLSECIAVVNRIVKYLKEESLI